MERMVARGEDRGLGGSDVERRHSDVIKVAELKGCTHPPPRMSLSRLMYCLLAKSNCADASY